MIILLQATLVVVLRAGAISIGKLEKT